MKISHIDTSRLSKDVHFQFHTEFHDLVSAHGAEDLKIKPQFEAYLSLYGREEKEAMAELDEAYLAIAERINALALIEGAEVYDTFIRELNAVVAKYAEVCIAPRTFIGTLNAAVAKYAEAEGLKGAYETCARTLNAIVAKYAPFIKILRERPLLWVLPLLAVLYLMVIPANKMEFSDMKITRNGKTGNITLPYTVWMPKDEVFSISFNLFVKDKETAKFKMVPDDCIEEILVNGEKFPLYGIEGLCDYKKGVDFDFSKHIQEGSNSFELRMMNKGGSGGLRVETPLEISDAKITRNIRTENIALPYSVDMDRGEVFSISFNLSVKDKKAAKFKMVPDDCIEEILVNGEKFPLYGIEGLCDYKKGVDFDFSKHIQEGSNSFELRMMNKGGPGGLRVRIPCNVFESLSLIQHIFVMLFLFFIVLVLRKQHYVKLNRETIFACALTLPFVVHAFMVLLIRINYELSGAYTADTTGYWAIGRAMLNGIAPWTGLFENKPLGIFLLSAISFKVFDSPVFTHYFQAFVLILTAAVPVAAYFLLSSYRSVLKFAFSLLAGLLLALYSGWRAGEVQTESFGAAFACIAVFAMAMPDFEKRKILWISLAAIGLLGGCGFKEPFLFPLLGASLIFCKGYKDWLCRFVLPLLIAVGGGILILLIFGLLDDYLHHLNYMSSIHIFSHGSPFRRGMSFDRLYNDMNAFSWGLAVAVLALLSLPFVLANSKSNENTLLQKVAFFVAAFFLASYSVGIGGHYYNHHYIFALPFYTALFLLLLKEWNGENFAASKLALFSFAFLAIAALNFPGDLELINLKERSEYLKTRAKESMQAALYLDKKMDELGIDRYAFIGGNGPQIYGWTKHIPSGPYFFQLNDYYKLIPGSTDSVISNIKKADIVVVSRMWDPIAPQVNPILAEQFTETRVNWYKVYFRKNKMGQQ